jgi:hypothetical protein
VNPFQRYWVVPSPGGRCLGTPDAAAWVRHGASLASCRVDSGMVTLRFRAGGSTALVAAGTWRSWGLGSRVPVSRGRDPGIPKNAGGDANGGPLDADLTGMNVEAQSAVEDEPRDAGSAQGGAQGSSADWFFADCL